MWEYRAQMVRVIDGDTIILMCDTGFGGRQEESFRLLGVWAPEINRPGGKETAEFARRWFASRPALKWPLLVRTEVNSLAEPEEKRTFTRYLATLSDASGGPSLNAELRGFLAENAPRWARNEADPFAPETPR